MRTPDAVRISQGLLAFALLAGSAATTPAQTSKGGTPPGATYVGSSACRECHEQLSIRFGNSKMAKVMLQAPRNEVEKQGCESCHGPGSTHISTEKARDAAKAAGQTYTGPKSSQFIIRFGKDVPLTTDEQNDRCLQCHEKGQRMFWAGSSHESRGVGCVSCHKIHGKESDTVLKALLHNEKLSKNDLLATNAETETCFECHPMRRAQTQRSSHMPVREGSMTCSSCHNPHGTPNPKLLTTASVNDTCYKCHPERRGPFLWEHAPVMENCLNCHDPHGSNAPQLLKERMPRLCQNCHDVSGHNAQPLATNSRYVYNRSCTNCHSTIHGSNSEAGSRFQR